MARTRVVSAFSAGGVVYRLSPSAHSPRPAPLRSLAPDEPPDPLAGVEIALVGRLPGDVWVLPKGTPLRHEEPPDTAVREVREETGLITRIVAPLDSIRYTFSRDGTRFNKEVLHYLLEAVGGDVSLHDHEYDEARWFPLREAQRRLTFRNEADLVRLAEPLIARALSGAALTPPGDITAPADAAARRSSSPARAHDEAVE